MYPESYEIMVKILEVLHLMAFIFLTDAGDMRKEQEENIYSWVGQIGE